MAELVDLPLPAGRRAGFKTQFEIMFYVYAISSETRAYIYVGLTSDVENRLARHNSGREKTTRPYRPFKLIMVEEASTRIEARKREKYWKSGVGKEQLKTLT